MELVWEAAIREMRAMIAKHPGFEPESLKCQPFMVPYECMTRWADAMDKCISELYREAELRRIGGTKK